MEKIKQHLLDTLDMTGIEEIVKHGCGGGIGGFIYYTETCAFHDEYESEIWDMLHDDAEDQGLTIMELLALFNDQQYVGSMNQFKNMLCWYAVESVANHIINELEEADNE